MYGDEGMSSLPSEIDGATYPQTPIVSINNE